MSTKDHYEVLEALGTGSFGTVNRIRRKADGKVMVWKEINFGGMSEKEKTQLVAEVNILRELRNPFVVRYHDRIVDKPRTRLYIIMEHCAGGDLGRVIKKSRQTRTHIEESFIWKVFAQAVLALKDCHRRVENGECKPILHRDLKPANILLDSDQNIKIADFGLAKELSSQSKLAQTNVGTPFYMAPEIINEKDYDEKSDIWSLGCLLYELAALKPPFDATNAVSLANKINTGRYLRIPSRYSDALYDAIRLMLQVDARKRPRVEDLESLPSLQPALAAARNLVQDFRFQQNQANKLRELKSREEAVQAREEKLSQWESQLKEKEQHLALREQALKRDLDHLHSQQTAALHAAAALKKAAPAAANRRMSYDRVTEQMVVDEELGPPAYPLAELPASLLPRAPLQPPASASAVPPAPPGCPSSSSSSSPSSSATTQPAFEIFDDLPRGEDASSVHSGAQAPPPAPPLPVRYIARRPAHVAIKTGAELAKENVPPAKFLQGLGPAGKAAAGPVPSTAGAREGGGDAKAVLRRAMATEAATDAASGESPLKKPRLGVEAKGPGGRAALGLGLGAGHKPAGVAAPLPMTVQIDLDALLRPRYHR